MKDGNRTLEHFLERNERFSAAETEAEFLVDHFKQMGIVVGEDFGKNIVATGSEMAVDHLRDGLETLHDFIKFRRVIEYETDVGTSLVAYRRRVDDSLKSPDHARRSELLDALVYRSPRNVGLSRNLKKRFARIIGEHFKNLEIKSIEVLS